MHRKRLIVGAVVGLAFAAAAGVGLAQITSEPSSTASAVSTGAQTTASTGREDDFADEPSESKDDLEFEQGDSGTEMSPTSTLSAGAPTSTNGAGQEKVVVCHVTGNGSSHSINIARPAVAAHVAHGDSEGACAATTTSAAQTTTSASTKKPKHHVQSTSHGNSSHTTSHGNANHTKPHGHVTHSSHVNSGGHGKGHNK